MNIDAELDVWRQQWQADTAVPLDLQKSVERQTRLMKIGLAADTLVTVVMGGGTTWWALSSPEPEITVVAITTWIFLFAAWAFVLTVNRGLWAPSALDAATFVDLSLRRCRSALTTVWFAAALFLSEIAFGLGWAYYYSVRGNQSLSSWLLFSSFRIDMVWLCTVAFFCGAAWYWRKKRRELDSLLSLRDEMSAPFSG